MPALTEAVRRGVPRRFQARLRYWYRDLRLNSVARNRFQSQPARLGRVQQVILEGLRRDGVALISLDEFAGDSAVWEELSRLAEEFSRGLEVRRRIQAYQESRGRGNWKDYLVRLFRPISEVPSDHPLLKFGVGPQLLNLANTYLGLWAKLLYFDLWYTIPLRLEREKVASQRWHRDPDDERMLKVFLYLSDVDESAGPLEYVKGSNASGPYYSLFRAYGRHYPPQDEFDRLISPADRLLCTGSRGTLVFCDTRGFHRGGFATRNARILAKWAYVSPASLSPRAYRVRWAQKKQGWSEAARFAVT